MWNSRTRLGLALLLSLLLHAALVGEVRWKFPEPQSRADPIRIELVQVRSAPAPASKPAVPAKPRPSRPKPVVAEPVSAEPAAPEPVAPVDAPVNEVARPDEPAPSAVASEPPPAPPSPVPVQPPVAPAVASVTAGAVEEAAGANDEVAAMQPLRVAIDYRVLHKGDVVGTEQQRYQVRPDGSYQLSSVIEPSGLLSLVLSELRQSSEGIATEHGLRPRVFTYQYGNKAERLQKAVFDWQQNRLWQQSGRRVEVVDLPHGAQDLMSFMYQFMFVPPLQQMSLAITNGKRLKIYTYSFEGEKTLQTPMGDLRCMHIARLSDDGEEKTELWLAADYHNLPVKIRVTEKDNKVTERNAVRLQLDDEIDAD